MLIIHKLIAKLKSLINVWRLTSVALQAHGKNSGVIGCCGLNIGTTLRTK